MNRDSFRKEGEANRKDYIPYVYHVQKLIQIDSSFLDFCFFAEVFFQFETIEPRLNHERAPAKVSKARRIISTNQTRGLPM